MRMTTVLYIHRDFVGREIPFDKIYFFHKDDEESIPKVFSNGFVLPINKFLCEAVKDILKKSRERASAPPLEETEALSRVPRSEYQLRYKMHGYNRLDRDEQAEANRETIRVFENEILEHRENYLAFVPVLFTKQKPRLREKDERKTNKKKVYPQYLTALARRKADKPAQLAAQVVGARAYFIYKGKAYRPLCLLCPRSIDSVVGDCSFGQKDCYHNLGRVGVGDFTRGIKAYKKLVQKIDEPELDMKEAANA